MPTRALRSAGFKTFRLRLLLSMAFVVLVISLGGLWFEERKVKANTERELGIDFQNALTTLHFGQEIRRAALAERCRTLVRKSRIHAALEDNALDLLYPSAKDELQDVMIHEPSGPHAAANPILQAKFYRFLETRGAVITPAQTADCGPLPADEEAQLALRKIPELQQTAYLLRREENGRESIDEVIVMPIFSSETGESIAAIALGFEPAVPTSAQATSEMKSGIWMNGRLYLPGLPEAARRAVGQAVGAMIVDREESSLNLTFEGAEHRLFFKRLNPDSLFPPAYEVCVYSLQELLARQAQLRWQAAGVSAVLLFGGFVACHFLAARLSRPVERLVVDSDEDRSQRARAEAELELTSEDLARAARFSSDTSHQLKTPVTVMRAGLEELLGRDDLPVELREDVGALVHQTFRLTNIIEDLLLLSRMDAGRLRLEFEPVNLNRIIEGWLDDLSAMPDGPQVEVELTLPENFEIAGEKRYTSLILENLLTNARKYNRPEGEIRILGEEDGEWAVLTIANTGKPIPAAARDHIFERFHRGGMAENVPGHGLGLNLARELVKLHHGELRLLQSDENWTVFEVRLRPAGHPLATLGSAS